MITLGLLTAAAAILALFALVLHTIRQLHAQKTAFEKTFNRLQLQLKMHQQENRALVNADLTFGRQIHEFGQQLISIENQLQSLENQRSNDGAHQHALRILAMGGDKEEIIKNCHLSNAEAELIMNLHAYQVALR